MNVKLRKPAKRPCGRVCIVEMVILEFGIKMLMDAALQMPSCSLEMGNVSVESRPHDLIRARSWGRAPVLLRLRRGCGVQRYMWQMTHGPHQRLTPAGTAHEPSAGYLQRQRYPAGHDGASTTHCGHCLLKLACSSTSILPHVDRSRHVRRLAMRTGVMSSGCRVQHTFAKHQAQRPGRRARAASPAAELAQKRMTRVCRRGRPVEMASHALQATTPASVAPQLVRLWRCSSGTVFQQLALAAPMSMHAQHPYLSVIGAGMDDGDKFRCVRRGKRAQMCMIRPSGMLPH